MSDTNNTKVGCCQEHYPRKPYFHVEQQFDYCCIGCDKPGVGSMEHNPGNNSCGDCALIFCPCALLMDIICCIPIVFGYWTVQNPN